jgi:hypothetical protein
VGEGFSGGTLFAGGVATRGRGDILGCTRVPRVGFWLVSYVGLSISIAVGSVVGGCEGCVSGTCEEILAGAIMRVPDDVSELKLRGDELPSGALLLRGSSPRRVGGARMGR